MQIAVVALGKIGLPLAVQFAQAGHNVVGVDLSQRVVELVNDGVEPFPGEATLQKKLHSVVSTHKLRATTDYGDAIPGADVVVVVVPLFVDEETWEPDFTQMDAATRCLSEHLSSQTIVSYETTLPVGTTRGRWKPIIEATSGLREGSGFHLVFSPERVLTGRVFADLKRYPKLVGGLTKEGVTQAIAFYSSVLTFDERPDLNRPNGVWDMGNAETAELAKLAETTYRDVNIGLANQFAIFADKADIDVHKVIEACNSQPYSHIHNPGIAVGGHCIPVYPRLYLSTDPDASIVRAARVQNAGMPAYAVSQAEALLGDLKGISAVILGASYRGGVKETAFSGVFGILEALKTRGADVRVHDPMYSNRELTGFGWRPYELGEAVDLAFVQADHAQYSNLTPGDFPGIRLLVDGRRVTDPTMWRGTPRIEIGASGTPRIEIGAIG